MSELRYAYDLYPRDDPRDGARIIRFSQLEAAEWNAEANGTGSGFLVLPADSTDADSIDPAGLQYVRVVEIDPDSVDGATLSGFAERVVFGFFLDTGTFEALTERNSKKLTFGGAGTLSYWARASMAPHTYLDIAIGQDPFDDTWRLYAQGPIAGGDMLGAVLWRVLYEAQHFRVALTEHRHADGIIYTDSHADDRTVNAVPDAVIDFTAFLDSDGAAWDEASGEFKVQVLDNVLSVIKLAMEAGLYVEMDPDTFETRAYQASSHRRDRTGGAWGASVIRFQAPTDGTLATGNILSDAKRALTPHIQRSLLWAGGGDVYAKATGTFDIPWEGGYRSDVADTTALGLIAARQILGRDDAGDTLHVRSVPLDDPGNGFYRLLHSTGILLDDLVTVDSGAGTWDFDEQTFPVAAVGAKLRAGGDWDAMIELGASFRPMESRQFQVPGIGSHSHLPNPALCQPDQIDTPELVSSGGEANTGAISIGDVPALTNGMLLVVTGWFYTTNPPPKTPFTAEWGADGDTYPLTRLGDACIENVAGIDLAIEVFYLLNPVEVLGVDNLLGAADDIAGGVWKGWFLLENVNQSNPFASIDTATGQSGASSGINITDGQLLLNAVFGAVLNASHAAATPDAGQTQSWSLSGNPPRFSGGYGDATPTWTFDQTVDWAAVGFGINGAGSGGDSGPMPVGANGEADHGTSVRATRCDHVHPHSDLSDHDDETHHAIASIDGLEAALAAASGADLSGIDFLVGTASGDLSAEIVVGTTPGGELGGTWASPTVDAVHSGSAHLTVEDIETAGRWEVLMADGVTFPPDPLTTEDGTDWLYGWVEG